MTRDEVFARLSAIRDRTAANDNDMTAEYKADLVRSREAILAERLSYAEIVSRLAEYDVQTAFIVDRWRAEICAREQTEMLVHEILRFRKARAAGGGRETQSRRFEIPTAEAKKFVWDAWGSGDHPTKDAVATEWCESLGREWQTVRDWLKEPRAANQQHE